MRFMILVKATKSSEAGALPSEELLAKMGKFNEDLIKAGVLLVAEGLQASSKGARVKFAGDKRTVIDGPFAETKELVAGFWLWKCASLQEAIEWDKRCPNPMPGEEAEIEVRQVFEPEDFSPAFRPELREEDAHTGRKALSPLTPQIRKKKYEIYLPWIHRREQVGDNVRKRAERHDRRVLRLRRRAAEERSLCWRRSAPKRPERHYPAMEERQGVDH